MMTAETKTTNEAHMYEDGGLTDDTVVSMNLPHLTFCTRNVEVFYGETQALFGIDLDIFRNQVTALIGPSGCGKSTYLRVGVWANI